ncbi:hypothetical protein VDF90_06365 [Xanthomonas campestris pv. raphani]|uniref:hypothetical protein n=1 Tax=Xanthomonas campestris TaxID=339 RepID=UPI002B22ED4F|nr:hypothetical protein [Xanthomonas campestris]MEA9786881.1 hypothetical protein [Xanthomonas campestris pv. raphani]
MSWAARPAVVKGNFAFDKVQRLPGNIGYEKFRIYAYPYLAPQPRVRQWTSSLIPMR